MIVGAPGKENGLDEFQHLDDYALLGVSSGATLDDIKQAYRREITKYHPDRFRMADPQTQQYARERSQRITEAYSTLSRGARQRAGAGFRNQPTVRTPASASRSAQFSAASQLGVVYQQATTRLGEGHVDEAIRLLQQIQRVDPFYRDVDELLARAEHMRATSGVGAGEPQRRPFWWLAAGVVSVVALLVGVWSSGIFPSGRVAESTPAAVIALGSTAAPSVPTFTATATPLPAATPSSVSSPAATAPVVVVPTDISPTSAPPPTESAPTATIVAPTEVPATPPAALPTESVATPAAVPSPTAAPPIAQATRVPAPRPVAVESGRVLISDTFNDPSSGWANLQTATYTLGYRDGAYAITTEAGTGSIFSFGAPLAQGNVVLGADVTPVRGLAGVLFGPDNSFRFFISGDGRFRVDQQGNALVPATASNAIRRGTNRLAIAAAGRRASLYANGVLLTNLDLPASLEGTTYGFVVLSGPRGGEGVFDSLTVRTLPR